MDNPLQQPDPASHNQPPSKLNAIMQRMKPRTTLTFDDLVVPLATRRQIDELRDRIALYRVH